MEEVGLLTSFPQQHAPLVNETWTPFLEHITSEYCSTQGLSSWAESVSKFCRMRTVTYEASVSANCSVFLCCQHSDPAYLYS